MGKINTPVMVAEEPKTDPPVAEKPSEEVVKEMTEGTKIVDKDKSNWSIVRHGDGIRVSNSTSREDYIGTMKVFTKIMKR